MYHRPLVLATVIATLCICASGLLAPARALASGSDLCRITSLTIMRDGSLDIRGEWEHPGPLLWPEVQLFVSDPNGRTISIELLPNGLGPETVRQFDIRLHQSPRGFTRDDLRDGDSDLGTYWGYDELGNLVGVSGNGFTGMQGPYPFLVTSADAGTDLTWQAMLGNITEQYHPWLYETGWQRSTLVRQPWPYENPYPDPMGSGDPTDSPADQRPVVVLLSGLNSDWRSGQPVPKDRDVYNTGTSYPNDPIPVEWEPLFRLLYETPGAGTAAKATNLGLDLQRIIIVPVIEADSAYALKSSDVPHPYYFADGISTSEADQYIVRSRASLHFDTTKLAAYLKYMNGRNAFVNSKGQALPIVLVGHSYGGIIERNLLEDSGFLKTTGLPRSRFRGLIQLGSPNGGSELADLSNGKSALYRGAVLYSYAWARMSPDY